MKSLKSWDEGFYTKDYDQEMLDFIDENYNVDWTVSGWSDLTYNLCYSERDNDFYLISTSSESNLLTKEEFKRKIGMIPEKGNVVSKNTFSKSDLVDGMFVKFVDGEYRLVLAGNLHKSEGFCPLDSFTEDLLFGHGEGDDTDIVEVLTDDGSYTLKTNLELGYGLKSIWKRPPEKTPSQLKLEVKLEDLQQKMEALHEEMNMLQKSIEPENKRLERRVKRTLPRV